MSEPTPGAMRAATRIQEHVGQILGKEDQLCEQEMLAEWIDEETAAPDLLAGEEATSTLADLAANLITSLVDGEVDDPNAALELAGILTTRAMEARTAIAKARP